MTFKNAMFSKMFLIRRTTRISVAQKLLWSTITLLASSMVATRVWLSTLESGDLHAARDMGAAYDIINGDS